MNDLIPRLPLDLGARVAAIERLVIELALISIASQHFTDNRKSNVSRLLEELEYAGIDQQKPSQYEQLYALVESYLCTPNEQAADAYDNLVAWFVRNKRPDGTEPRPVTTQ